jgi:cysteine-rich repeat protein
MRAQRARAWLLVISASAIWLVQCGPVEGRLVAVKDDGSAAAPGDVGAGRGGSETSGSGGAGAASASNQPPPPGAAFGIACDVEGQVVCAGPEQKQRLVCEGGSWDTGAPCAANQNCDRPTGDCLPIVAECANQMAGFRFCGETGSVKICGLDRVRLETESCDGTCFAGQCMLPGCGDGRVDAVEQCDDGNQSNIDGCTNLCRSPACGDGFQQSGEECDDGNLVASDLCTNSCRKPECGDAIVQSGEECDDGNAIDNDATCTNTCRKPKCGDEVIQAGEACDDGNTIDADGCSGTCTVLGCGDGAMQANEECDDGNQVNTDLCTVACKKPRCGDSFTQPPEACDDGNSDDQDGCSNDCFESGCGDGVEQMGEECDDGNTVNTDACTALCTAARCGDGLISLDETCEDGNSESNDGCSSVCKREECGDDITQSWEGCDDGNRVDGDDCTNSCERAGCGDGVAMSGSEQCDDGNDNDFDGCTNDCKTLPKLSTLNGGCNQANQATRTVCIEAASKWCTTFGYPVGFALGPESGGLTVGCMNDVEKFSGDLDYDEDFGAACQQQQQSPGCLVKAHAACLVDDKTHELGFFLSPSRDEVVLACAPGTAQSVNAAELSGCSLSAANFASIECVAAVQKFCQSKGSDGGMIQGLSADGKQVSVTCVRLAKTGSAKF